MEHTIEKSFAKGYIGKSLVAKNLIIAHESGNANNVGKSALDNELSYMKNNIKSANVTHWVGNGGRIVQILPNGKVTWGAGGRANPYAYAQVELARTNDKEQFKKDYVAYIWLLRYLASEAGIPKTLDVGSKVTDKGIKTHLWVTEKLGNTNHTDPYGYLASMGISKEQFKEDITNGIGSNAPEPSKPAISGSYIVRVGDTLWGIANTHKSTVDYIKSINGLKSDAITPGQVLKLSGLSVKPVVKPVAKPIVAAKPIVKPVVKPVAKAPVYTTESQNVGGVQTFLNKWFNAGLKVDNVNGDATKKAIVKAIQAELNKQFNAKLLVDGDWGNSTEVKWNTVRKKASGNLTRLIQAMLICKGYKINGFDGKFGDGLEKAIMVFQKNCNIDIDAEIGKATARKLFN